MHSDATSDETPDSSRDRSGGKQEGTDDGVTRRTFLKTTGATAAAAGTVVAGSSGAEAQTQTYRFGGEVAAWQGRSPSAIEGASNPTIELQAGQEYEFWFENLDGAPHNMTIQDAEGSTIVQSELIREEGATASVTFTATPAMAQYICTIHPTTMVGDVNVVGEAGGGEGGGGFQIGFQTAVFAAAILLAFVSPLLFAVFLFSRRGGSGGETTAR
jgi:hypothetical protein